MLTVRTEQMHVLDQDLLRKFADSVADDIFLSIPAAVAGKSWSRVSRECLQALYAGRELWKLSDRRDLYGFVLLSILCGPEFHQKAEIRSALSEFRVADGRKMLVLAEAMLDSIGRGGEPHVPRR